MNSQSFHIKSYGCQMNVYDSQKICSFLKKEGLSEKDNTDDADIVVFNTCNISLFTLSERSVDALITQHWKG